MREVKLFKSLWKVRAHHYHEFWLAVWTAKDNAWTPGVEGAASGEEGFAVLRRGRVCCAQEWKVCCVLLVPSVKLQKHCSVWGATAQGCC